MADKQPPLPTTAGISCKSFYAGRAPLTSNTAKNKAAYRIAEEIPSSSSDDEDSDDECSDNSDEEWLPEKNRDIGAEDDGDTDSQDAESENDEGQDAEEGQHDQGTVEDGQRSGLAQDITGPNSPR